jgi:hypothetical protein
MIRAMADPEHLRQLAERMLALATKTDDPKLAELLATAAISLNAVARSSRCS